MGGSGSGRHWSSKSTTDDYIQLDVRRLGRKSLLEGTHAFTWQWSRNGEPSSSVVIQPRTEEIVLSYRSRSNGGEWEDQRYAVELERIPCHLGGERVYFRCPVVRCGRRVAILYGGTILACRYCHKLGYECQREAPHYRALRKAQKLSDRLGGTGYMVDPVWRPKGMHRKTFEKLENRLLRLTSRMNALAAAYFRLP